MVEIIAALILGVVGLAAYSIQERLKRRTALAEKKQEIYIELIDNVILLLGADAASQRSELLSRIEHAWLYASDPVLRNIYDYLKAYDESYVDDYSMMAQLQSDTKLMAKFNKLIARIFLEMRREVRRDISATKIDSQWAEDNVKLYGWGIVTADE